MVEQCVLCQLPGLRQQLEILQNQYEIFSANAAAAENTKEKTIYGNQAHTTLITANTILKQLQTFVTSQTIVPIVISEYKLIVCRLC